MPLSDCVVMTPGHFPIFSQENIKKMASPQVVKLCGQGDNVELTQKIRQLLRQGHELMMSSGILKAKKQLLKGYLLPNCPIQRHREQTKRIIQYFEKAIHLINVAEEKYSDIRLKKNIQVWIYFCLFSTHMVTGSIEKAIYCQEKMLEMHHSRLKHKHIDSNRRKIKLRIVECQHTLARLFYFLDKPVLSRKYLQKSIDNLLCIRQEIGDTNEVKSWLIQNYTDMSSVLINHTQKKHLNKNETLEEVYELALDKMEIAQTLLTEEKPQLKNWILYLTLSIAKALKKNNKFKEASEVYTNVIAEWDEYICYTNLDNIHNEAGLCFDDQKKPKDAAQHFLKAINIREKRVGSKDNFSMRELYHNLAIAYERMSNTHGQNDNTKQKRKCLQLSLNSFKETLRIEIVCGADAIDLAESHDNISAILNKMGDKEVACEHLKQAIQMYKKAKVGFSQVKPKYKRIFKLYNDIINSYEKQANNYKKIIKYCDKALFYASCEAVEESFVEEIIDLLISKGNANQALHYSTKKPNDHADKSVVCFERVLELEQSIGDTSRIAKAHFELSLTYQENMRLEEARIQAHKARELRLTLYKPDDAKVIAVDRLLLQLGVFPEAIMSLDVVRSIYKTTRKCFTKYIRENNTPSISRIKNRLK